MRKPLILIGPSGAGKTTAGRAIAERLGRAFVDTDARVEAAAGRSIADIFAAEGEQSFRRHETEALRRALSEPPCVVATGGGVVETPENADLLQHGLVVWLAARPAAIAARLAGQTGRPLLRDDPARAIEAQAARRAPLYAGLADWIVQTDHLARDQVVAEILRFVEMQPGESEADLVVRTPGGVYPVVVAPGAIAQLPERLTALGLRGRVWVVSDDNVWSHHGAALLHLLHDAGFEAPHHQVAPGEASKQIEVVRRVYDWMLAGGVERGDVLLAFGGGVVGDLAGFVASTVLRGIALVHAPTTVLSMVDSSIGGKTGVDHPAGKNLVGTFYQPRLVLSDTRLLQTLPPSERRMGWAEAIKHGVIRDAPLFDDLVAHAPALLEAAEPPVAEMIRRAASVKVRVVSGDEREQGDRILLNYGHTLGHAIEQWSHYAVPHGEAVAMGMSVAASIARRIGLIGQEIEERQREALRAFGLPVRVPEDAPAEALLQAARSDKKARSRKLRWVLPTALGAATVRGDVDDEVVLAALRERGAG